MIGKQRNVVFKQKLETRFHHSTDLAWHVIPEQPMMDEQHIHLLPDLLSKTLQVRADSQTHPVDRRASNYLHTVGAIILELAYLQIIVEILHNVITYRA